MNLILIFLIQAMPVLRVGDIITSPDYSTPIQVIDVQEGIIEKVGPTVIKTINISSIRFPYVYVKTY